MAFVILPCVSAWQIHNSLKTAGNYTHTSSDVGLYCNGTLCQISQTQKKKIETSDAFSDVSDALVIGSCTVSAETDTSSRHFCDRCRYKLSTYVFRPEKVLGSAVDFLLTVDHKRLHSAHHRFCSALLSRQTKATLLHRRDRITAVTQ